jgi:hypothetical protein
MMSKHTAKARAPDNALKTLPAEKEKTSSVAKIKVVVCSLVHHNLFIFTCFTHFSFEMFLLTFAGKFESFFLKTALAVWHNIQISTHRTESEIQ